MLGTTASSGQHRLFTVSFPFNPLCLPVNPSSSVQPGSLLIDCSTIAPEEARTMAGLTQGKEASFIDAPVSGGVCVCVCVREVEVVQWVV